jgi:CHAD domain-containing protein
VSHLEDEAPHPAGPGVHHHPDPDALRRSALAAVAGRHRALADLPRGPLEDLDDAALHHFRIEAKKLRYTLEFFAPLLPGAEERIGMLRKAQDLLGTLHDLADLGGLAADLANRAREAGYGSAADPFERLGARLERRRRADGRRFRPLHETLTGAGFLAGMEAAHHHPERA